MPHSEEALAHAEERVLSAGVRRSEGVSLRNPVMPVFDSLPR
jgi:hypothetical protein